MFNAKPFNIWRNVTTDEKSAQNLHNSFLETNKQKKLSMLYFPYLRAYLLNAIEMILIPASDIPVKNLMMTNITYDVENALRTANIVDDK